MTSADHKLARNVLASRKLALESCGTDFEELLGQDLYPRFLGRILSMLLEGADETGRKYDQLITEIPTETSVAERRFLCNFFRYVWHGQYHVLEIGPFLGGTTRAMALGMLLNPNRSERARLHTFDKFEDYYNADRLLKTLAPLFDSGVLAPEIKQHIRESSEFQTVFRALHAGESYYKLLQHTAGCLPNTPGEVGQIGQIFACPPGFMTDAVFVDGCKSWYGTKFFMQAICDHLLPESYFFLQDYGAHTCFWIPVFAGMFRDHLKLVAHVNDTYTFRLTKIIDKQEIAARFTDSPEQMGAQNFAVIFRGLIQEAGRRSDTFAVLNLQLQHAGALAYLGDTEQARERILGLLHRAEYSDFRRLILSALDIPTYRPGTGNINL